MNFGLINYCNVVNRKTITGQDRNVETLLVNEPDSFQKKQEPFLGENRFRIVF